MRASRRWLARPKTQCTGARTSPPMCPHVTATHTHASVRARVHTFPPSPAHRRTPPPSPVVRGTSAPPSPVATNTTAPPTLACAPGNRQPDHQPGSGGLPFFTPLCAQYPSPPRVLCATLRPIPKPALQQLNTTEMLVVVYSRISWETLRRKPTSSRFLLRQREELRPARFATRRSCCSLRNIQSTRLSTRPYWCLFSLAGLQQSVAGPPIPVRWLTIFFAPLRQPTRCARHPSPPGKSRRLLRTSVSCHPCSAGLSRCDCRASRPPCGAARRCAIRRCADDAPPQHGDPCVLEHTTPVRGTFYGHAPFLQDLPAVTLAPFVRLAPPSRDVRHGA